MVEVLTQLLRSCEGEFVLAKLVSQRTYSIIATAYQRTDISTCVGL